MITFVYGMYFMITGLFGFKNMKKTIIRCHIPKHKFAILVAARNEEDVVGNLVKSLKNQDYPDDLYEIYIIPNNCTDNTALVAKEAGAKVMPCTVPVKSKGEVLHFALDNLANRKDIDAYVVFDADNAVHKNFLGRMNDALCDGHKVAQGFRDSKNASDNWISGSYSIFYWIQNFFFNKARMQLRGSATINGTGFMIKKEIIDEYGFNTITMTEDIEYTAQCAIRNIPIVFVEDAITYDEQPFDFNTSWKQRKRWSTGNLQCLATYSKQLLKGYRKNGNLPAFDMFLVFLNPVFMILGFVLIIMLVTFRMFGIQLYDLFAYMFAYGLFFFIIAYLLSVVLNIFIVKYNNRKSEHVISGILFFPLFMFTWLPINLRCIFKKELVWAQIKHSRNVELEELAID